MSYTGIIASSRLRGESIDITSFITTWETTTSSESITIPTTSIGYNYRVDWGDGTITQGHTGDATHIYDVAGIYTVKISGDFPRIHFNNEGDRLKIKSIEQWGTNVWGPFNFWGCENMVGNYTDIPNLANTITTFAWAFRECSVFNGSVDGWDMSGVTSLSNFFFRAYLFDQSLESWDVSNVTSMTAFLANGALSTDNYDATLIAWAALPVLQSDINFHAGFSKYSPAAEAARNILINDYGWNITDGGLYDPFITTWETTTPSESITIPTTGGGFNYEVDWGDGIITQGHTGDATHIYDVAGIYTVKISGDFPRIYFNGDGDRLKIKSIEHWGSGAWGPFNFRGCENMVANYTDVPNILINGGFNHTFRDCYVFNGSVDGWDVSGITNMSSVFLNAYLFDQSLGSWDVSNMTSFTNIFTGVTLSTDSYDDTLIGWAALPSLQMGVGISFGNAKYSPAAEAARNKIINDYSWTINDGGPV